MYVDREDMMRVVMATGNLLTGRPVEIDHRRKVQEILKVWMEEIDEDKDDDEAYQEYLEKRKHDMAFAIKDCHEYIKWKIKQDSFFMDEDEEDNDDYQRLHERNMRKGWQIKKQN